LKKDDDDYFFLKRNTCAWWTDELIHTFSKLYCNSPRSVFFILQFQQKPYLRPPTRFVPNKTISKVSLFYLLSIKTIVMQEFLYILIVIFGFFGLAFLLLNLRQLFTGQEFRGTCASNNPMLKNQLGECTVCGKKPQEDCKMPEAKAN